MKLSFPRRPCWLSRQWYAGLYAGLAEEGLRYLKPQGTEFKAIIGMNAYALRDWFAIRCCLNAQERAGIWPTRCVASAPRMLRISSMVQALPAFSLATVRKTVSRIPAAGAGC